MRLFVHLRGVYLVRVRQQALGDVAERFRQLMALVLVQGRLLVSYRAPVKAFCQPFAGLFKVLRSECRRVDEVFKLREGKPHGARFRLHDFAAPVIIDVRSQNSSFAKIHFFGKFAPEGLGALGLNFVLEGVEESLDPFDNCLIFLVFDNLKKCEDLENQAFFVIHFILHLLCLYDKGTSYFF